MSERIHEEREEAARNAAMDRALDELRGLFDGLIILGTWRTEDGSSGVVTRADGNWYAQNGLARYFLRKREANADIEANAQAPKEDE